MRSVLSVFLMHALQLSVFHRRGNNTPCVISNDDDDDDQSVTFNEHVTNVHA